MRGGVAAVVVARKVVLADMILPVLARPGSRQRKELACCRDSPAAGLLLHLPGLGGPAIVLAAALGLIPVVSIRQPHEGQHQQQPEDQDKPVSHLTTSSRACLGW